MTVALTISGPLRAQGLRHRALTAQRPGMRSRSRRRRGRAAAGTWQLQTSGTSERLRAVSAVSEKVAWASGNKGTVLRTEDGGAPLDRRCRFPARRASTSGTSRRRATALPTSSASAPATSRAIYKTTDAGKTWVLQFTNPDPKAFYDAIAFWDERNGIAVGDPVDGRFTILRTSDGGRTWALTPEADRPRALPGDGMFAASGTCLVVQGRTNAWIGTGGARSGQDSANDGSRRDVVGGGDAHRRRHVFCGYLLDRVQRRAPRHRRRGRLSEGEGAVRQRGAHERRWPYVGAARHRGAPELQVRRRVHPGVARPRAHCRRAGRHRPVNRRRPHVVTAWRCRVSRRERGQVG